MKVIYLIAALAIIITTILAGFYLKAKKRIVALFGLMIGLFASEGCIKEKTGDAEQNNNQKIVNNLKTPQTIEEKIFATDEWEKLSKLWRKINEIQRLNSEIEKINNLDKINKQSQNTLKNIELLKQKNLLTEIESKNLSDIFNTRLNHLSRSYLATCYEEPDERMEKLIRTKSDIETQNNMLEILYKQNKINEEIYNKIKSAIESDLNSLYIKTTPLTIRLIMELNKGE